MQRETINCLCNPLLSSRFSSTSLISYSEYRYRSARGVLARACKNPLLSSTHKSRLFPRAPLLRHDAPVLPFSFCSRAHTQVLPPHIFSSSRSWGRRALFLTKSPARATFTTWQAVHRSRDDAVSLFLPWWHESACHQCHSCLARGAHAAVGFFFLGRLLQRAHQVER